MFCNAAAGTPSSTSQSEFWSPCDCTELLLSDQQMHTRIRLFGAHLGYDLIACAVDGFKRSCCFIRIACRHTQHVCICPHALCTDVVAGISRQALFSIRR